MGCTLEQHVTLEAVVAFTASYSKLGDHVSITQIADAAELHPKNAAQAIRGLANKRITSTGRVSDAQRLPSLLSGDCYTVGESLVRPREDAVGVFKRKNLYTLEIGIEVDRGSTPEDLEELETLIRIGRVALHMCKQRVLGSGSTNYEHFVARSSHRGGLMADRVATAKVAPGAGVTQAAGVVSGAEQVLQACRDSLKRLRRDHLDIYFLHWPDRTGVPVEETWGAMAELAEAGLVRAIGLSNYGIEEVQRCHGEHPVDAVQVGRNLIDYLDDRAYVARSGELGIAVTIFEPLASGILGGKTMKQVHATWTGAWRESAFYKRLLSPGNAEKSFAVADGLRPIAEALNATVAQVAIAWVLHQPGVAAAIAGSRDGRHMRENAGAAHVDLSSDVLERIEQLIPVGPTAATPAGS